jgi:diguanylate cyclase (GGDEF)-like protein/PAS domain S-box-containing protein
MIAATLTGAVVCSLTPRRLPNAPLLLVALYVTAVLCAAAWLTEARSGKDELNLVDILDQGSDLIIILGLDGRFLRISQSLTRLTGWLPTELCGGTCYQDYFNPEDLGHLRELCHNLREEREAYPLACRMRGKDGGWVWLEASVSMYRERRTGRHAGYVHVLRDISGRKAAEQRLHDAYHALEGVASIDGLTGIANRRRFDEALNIEWRRATRSGSSLSLLMIDVDYFKIYNDLYGHVRGDHCLRLVAEALRDSLRRPADLVARFGGEEFAVILPETTEDGAAALALEMCQRIELELVEHSGSPMGKVTVSIGCHGCVPEHGTIALPLVEGADDALYQAKSNGRNRVERGVMRTQQRVFPPDFHRRRLSMPSYPGVPTGMREEPRL